MHIKEATQIVRSPDETWDDKVERRLKELASQLPEESLWTAFRLRLGRLIHPLGIHSRVQHKRYDEVSDRLIDVGWVCWFCPRAWA